MNLLNSTRQLFGYGFPPVGRQLHSAIISLCPQAVNATLFPGIRVALDLKDETQRSTWWKGRRFEYPTGQVLSAWAADTGSVFFDIGANYGFFSWWLASCYPSLQIYPFEPNPKTFAKVVSVVQENQLANVHPQNFGLSDQNVELDLHEGIVDSGHSTFGAHPGLKGSPTAKVRVICFDQWCMDHGLQYPTSPSWVAKIDVEGFELKVLKGMQMALAAKAFRGIAIEINPYTLKLTNTSPCEISSLLSSFGYAVKGAMLVKDGNAFFELTKR
jgi:FkbM family methyltransferase